MADIYETIADAYLEDRKDILAAGEGLRTTAKWMMSAIGAVAVALSGGVAVFSNLGHLSEREQVYALLWAALFLLGVAGSILGCSLPLQSQNPSPDDPQATTVLPSLVPPYASVGKLKEALDEAATAVPATPTLFLRHHAALQKLLALVWYEKVAGMFAWGRWLILVGAIAAGIGFVGFVELTQVTTADADKPTKAAERAKTRAEAEQTRADAAKTRADAAATRAQNAAGAAQAAVGKTHADTALTRAQAAKTRSEITKAR